MLFLIIRLPIIYLSNTASTASFFKSLPYKVQLNTGTKFWMSKNPSKTATVKKEQHSRTGDLFHFFQEKLKKNNKISRTKCNFLWNLDR